MSLFQYLGLVFFGKSHPPGRVDFSERLYEKEANHFARANSACACSDCLPLTEFELTQLSHSFYMEKGWPDYKGDLAIEIG